MYECITLKSSHIKCFQKYSKRNKCNAKSPGDTSNSTKQLLLQPTVKHYASIVPTVKTKEEMTKWARGYTNVIPKENPNLLHNYSDNRRTTLSERGAVQEARRCLKCADSPCQKSCPTTTNIKAFISCIANKNYYGAAKTIFSDNPFGISCGMVCPSCSMCACSCNLNATEAGPINTRGLEQFATETFSNMGVKQTIDPCTPIPCGADRKICIVGAGPSGLTCATFLARLGYCNVHVYEREPFLGGCLASEVPQYKCSMSGVNFEVSMVNDLGVQFHCCCPLSTDGVTVEKLLKDNACAIYIAIGLPQANEIPLFKGLTPKMGFYTSKSFMPLAVKPTKWGLCGKKAKCQDVLKMHGTVIVLGGGDTAFRCATSSLRCGAKKVYVAFRDEVCQLAAVPEEVDCALVERCELMGYATPHRIHCESGKISSMTFARSVKQKDGRWSKDENQLTTIQVDYVISAYGPRLTDEKMIKALSPLKLNQWNQPIVDPHTLQTSEKRVFAGGDVNGLSAAVSTAVNDGKVGAWKIHCLLQDLPMNTPSKLPRFHTDIDEVDISIEVSSLKFCNPFGLASSPSSKSKEMICRAFKEGWAFAVTKTFSLKPALAGNLQVDRPNLPVCNLGPHQNMFFSISGLCDKGAEYWVESIKAIKEEYPDRIVIASITSTQDKAEWICLVEMVQKCADAFELAVPPTMFHNPECIIDVVKSIRPCVRKPIFVKLTPAMNIEKLAALLKEACADGVTICNSYQGLINLIPEGLPPNRTHSQRCSWSYGNVVGAFSRPLALSSISQVAKTCPGFSILATGGVESAEVALEYLKVGASLVQVGGAIHNQDFSIIDDYCSGLRALLYLQVRLPDWCGQSPPVSKTAKQQGGRKVQTICDEDGKFLPHFGTFNLKRKKLEVDLRVDTDGMLITADHQMLPDPPKLCEKVKVKKLSDIIGSVLGQIDIDEVGVKKKKMVASVDQDICINCGKCYMACNDTAYQAIEFDLHTHLPFIKTDTCTGCGLCRCVCPILDCIKLVPK